ncbi:effector-binding domain-containing protein [Saonia flava]|uniref:Effector-binding domain-containing protein n=1 Tax=Saonia flava TaxID=523696 RepID=A0A846R2R6_9FLAO|nr:GyrI-like domain-containing protein [Saonia flava]NJB71109.1 effector-binding domain-containing protein [Saonia flava]
MKKKIVLILGACLLVGLVWYLFIKPYDYLVTFKAKTFPGTINQTIKIWDKTMNTIANVEQKNLNQLRQQLKFGDSVHIYDWDIEPISDSLSKVRVYVTDRQHSLKNKIAIPFFDTDFEKNTKKTLIDFNEKLKEHISKFKVKIVGQYEVKSTYCAYISLKGTQYEKANGMMINYPFLSNTLAEKKVKLNGTPFVEVTNWDIQTDSIAYNFCFPIIKSDSLPIHEEIKYKQFTGKKALKAVYNGNYITSDRAWYALLDHAKKNKIEIEANPVEVFYNNPNFGGDELNWKAEIYMPLKD